MTDAQPGPGGVDSSIPAPARIYDYLLAGSNNFPADRAAAEQILKAVPEIRDAAWSNRGFHQRAARWIAEHGIRQFVDIGSGLPTVGNTHEVVQRLVPEARVVYVDNDPLVRLHSQALLADNGSTTVILGDLRDPEGILGNPELGRLIDFAEPVGLLMTGVLMFVADDSDPYRLVARYIRELAPGSYLSLSHLSADHKSDQAVQGFRAVFDTATEQMYFRSKAEVARFFTGLELVPPYQGSPPELTYAGLWAAEDPVAADTDGSRWLWCGVGRRPEDPATADSNK
ncbi:MAG TPA: SAM-dependent methyltransferase [Streptosporangiaceae bacterium]